MTYQNEKNQNSVATQAEDDWYDQGFDLTHDSAQMQQFDFNNAFAIDSSRLKSAEAQFEQSAQNIVTSDAQDKLVNGTSDALHIEVETKGTISSNQHHNGPRKASIMVGGGNAREAVKEPNPFTQMQEEQSSGEYGTLSEHNNQILSAKDRLFLKNAEVSMSEHQDQALSKKAERERIARIRSERVKASEMRKQAARDSQYVQESVQMAHHRIKQSQAQLDAQNRNREQQQAVAQAAARQRQMQAQYQQQKEASSHHHHYHEGAYNQYQENAIEERLHPHKEAPAEPQAEHHAYNAFQEYVDKHPGANAEKEALQNAMDIAHHHTAQPTAQANGSFNRVQEMTPEQIKALRAQHHAPRQRPNHEKSLEELAAEHPELSPEDLIKLKRSNNRCHLVSRVPIFDLKGKILAYELKFTAGNVFQVNSLKSEHVYHILFGYFIRRGVSCFVGRSKNAMVMMPITYDLLNYIERYSVNRLTLRICPEQQVTPSALHLLTKLRRAGMSFAIELMLLLKKDWSKAILSIEFIMIDLSTKVNEQLQVFKRLKAKAPWLKTIGYNDVDGTGYVYLVNHQIDMYSGAYWSPEIKFSQDIDYFVPQKNTVLTLARELLSDKPDYTKFLTFLHQTEDLNRDLAVFLYRFRQASPRQVQNINDLYHYLLANHTNRAFTVVVTRYMMINYMRSASISSQNTIFEYYVQLLVRGFFAEYISKVLKDPVVTKFAFPVGVFSQLHLLLLEDEMDVLVNDNYADIIDKIYGYEPLADIIECAKAIESIDLATIFQFIQKYHVPPASVINSYEKGIMRTNELLLVLGLTTSRN